MKYENLFNDPEAILNQRLNEIPGDETFTMKQAGYNSVWKTFLSEYMQNGWSETVKQASLVDIDDSFDPFVQGQKEALDTIRDANENSFSRGWFSFIKNAYDVKQTGSSVDEFCKEAQLNMGEDMTLEDAGFFAASQNVLESDHNLIEIAWNGPNTIMETEQMNAFELGKEAALNDLIDYANDGATVSDCLEAIGDSVNQNLDKHASVEDADFRLGVETMCYDFMKQAGQTYGEYDTSSATDGDVLEVIFSKLAGERTDKIKDALGGAYESAKKRGQAGYERVKKTVAENPRAAKGVAAAGVLGAAGGLAYAGKKQYDKRKAEKTAGYVDPQIANAIAILEDAGLIND